MSNISIAQIIEDYNLLYKYIRDTIAPKICELLNINDLNVWNLDCDDELLVFHSENDVYEFEHGIYGYKGPHFFNENSPDIVCIRLRAVADECYEYFTVFIDATLLERSDWETLLINEYTSIFDYYFNQYLDRIEKRKEKDIQEVEKLYQRYLELKARFNEREMNIINENKNRMAGENLGKLVS